MAKNKHFLSHRNSLAASNGRENIQILSIASRYERAHLSGWESPIITGAQINGFEDGGCIWSAGLMTNWMTKKENRKRSESRRHY